MKKSVSELKINETNIASQIALQTIGPFCFFAFGKKRIREKPNPNVENIVTSPIADIRADPAPICSAVYVRAAIAQKIKPNNAIAPVLVIK